MRVEALAKVLAFEHPRECVLRGQLDHARRAETAEPLIVESNFGFLRVENFEHLAFVRVRVFFDLLVRQRRPRRFLAGWIADHAGEIADDENHPMAELLEVLHLPDHHGVTEVKVGRGGIEADFDSERLAARELRPKVLAIDEIDGTFREVIDLLVERHEARIVKAFFVVRSSLFVLRCSFFVPPGLEERTTKFKERAGNLTTPRTVSTLAQLYEIRTRSPVAPPS